MYIIAVRVITDNAFIQIQLDIASSPIVEISLSHYLTKSIEAYVNIEGNFSLKESRTNFFPTSEQYNFTPFLTLLHHFTITAEANPVLLTGLLFEIDSYFKKYMINGNCYLGLGHPPLQLNQVLVELSKSFLSYDSKELPPFVIADYIATEIVKIAPACAILKAVKLANPFLEKVERHTLIQEIKDKINNKLIKQDDAEYALICVSKRSKHRYFPPYHEISRPGSVGHATSFIDIALLRDALFAIDAEGKLVINLTENESYLSYYAPGKALHGRLEEELRGLVNGLNLEFAPETDWQTKLVFTKASSAQLIRQGIAVISEFFPQKELLVKRNQQEEVSKEASPDAVYSSKAFTIFNPVSNLPAGNKKPVEEQVEMLRSKK